MEPLSLPSSITNNNEKVQKAIPMDPYTYSQLLIQQQKLQRHQAEFNEIKRKLAPK